jgi:hypothetical protein
LGAQRRNLPPSLLVNETSPTLSADLDANGHKVVNVPTPTNAGDLVRKSDLDEVSAHVDAVVTELQDEIGQSATLEFDQTEASTLWTIAHNLGRRPSVTTVDTVGDEIEGQVHYVDANTVQVAFSPAVAGKAFLN